jgi:hypothetical protein
MGVETREVVVVILPLEHQTRVPLRLMHRVGGWGAIGNAFSMSIFDISHPSNAKPSLERISSTASSKFWYFTELIFSDIQSFTDLPPLTVLDRLNMVLNFPVGIVHSVFGTAPMGDTRDDIGKGLV